MAQNQHPTMPPEVPADLVAARREGWHVFTRMIFWNCVATAVLLLFLLLVFKVF